MLSKLTNMFRLPDLRGKIVFTLFILAVYRLGSHIPTPGVDVSAVQAIAEQSRRSGVLGFLNLFSGGALTRFAVFGLGIMPYITASIIMQLLQVVIPKFAEWRERGAEGHKKITQTTRYMTLGLALLQSTSLAFIFHTGADAFFTGGLDVDLIPDFTVPRVLLVVLSMTTGTAVVMWLGELIAQRGVGNGMSLLIFASIVSELPAAGGQVRAQIGNVAFAVVLAMALLVLASIVFIEQGQRRIPVQFAKRVVGRRQYAGQSTYIPMKVNQAGVIPIIFASSLLQFPAIIANALPAGADWATTVRSWLDRNLFSQASLTYVISFGVLIVGFAYFYSTIQFDPVQQADSIRKNGGYVPGHRPGPQTERHLAHVLNRITLPGSLFLAIIALIPSLALAIFQIQNFPFAGITLLIAVGVALETMKQIDSQLMMRNYEGFLRK